MNTRICQALAVLAMSSCAACSLLSGTSSSTRAQRSQGAPGSSKATHARAAMPASDAPSPIFGSPPPAVSRIARTFILGAADYDSAHERRRDFLNGLRGVSTASEWEALARSDRARVPWPVLRARSERANLTITGMSRHLQSDGSVVRVFVLGVLTTRSDLAVLRSFEDFSLTLVRQPGGWRIAAAEGPGL